MLHLLSGIVKAGCAWHMMSMGTAPLRAKRSSRAVAVTKETTSEGWFVKLTSSQVQAYALQPDWKEQESSKTIEGACLVMSGTIEKELAPHGN